jgi:hypothetical protein
MRKVCALVLLLFCQSVLSHGSHLQKVMYGGADITVQFGFLTGNSTGDVAGVCYGTHGVTATAANAARAADAAAVVNTGHDLPVLPPAPPPPLPRCHSEVYLLRSVQARRANLAGCIIDIYNEELKPCRMHYGQKFYGKREYNPGIPCHEYLQDFAQQNGCTINVTYPASPNVDSCLTYR